MEQKEFAIGQTLHFNDNGDMYSGKYRSSSPSGKLIGIEITYDSTGFFKKAEHVTIDRKYLCDKHNISQDWTLKDIIQWSIDSHVMIDDNPEEAKSLLNCMIQKLKEQEKKQNLK